MLVTTAYNPSVLLQAQAQELAKHLDAKYVNRQQFSLPRLRFRYQDADVLLLTDKEMRYFPQAAIAPIFFHPSTAAIRIKRLLNGELDPLLELADIKPGDSILDCTAGLASDAIVFSYAVGCSGKVIALESEPVLVSILQAGLASYHSEIEPINEAMRRVDVKQAEHYTYMKAMEDCSVDIVYFDPMFRSPIEQSNAISPLREIANGRAIQLDTIEEARRVARNKIILKEHKDSDEFTRLGFEVPYRPQTKIAYGVIVL